MALSANSEEQRQKLVTQLNQLRQSAGWKLVLTELKDSLAKTESGIFSIGGNEVKFSEKDMLNMRRELLLELINKPLKLATDLMPQHASSSEEFDPFS
jgi:hypothetical protein